MSLEMSYNQKIFVDKIEKSGKFSKQEKWEKLEKINKWKFKRSRKILYFQNGK